MKALVERSGGFTGIPMTTTVDTETLAPQDARQLQQLVVNSEFFSLPANIAVAKSLPDRFTYKVTIVDEGRSHTITVGETSLPGKIKPLLDFLNQNAKRAS